MMLQLVVSNQAPRKRARPVEYSPVAMSVWGKRVIWIRTVFDLSYREIAQESHLHHMQIAKMVNDPNYEPQYTPGQRFNRWYRARLRDMGMKAQRVDSLQ